MSIKHILWHPDPHLKKTCAVIQAVDGSIRELADDLLETMYRAPGVGLAAPQVGLLKRLFVLDCTAKDEDNQSMVLINPAVVWTSKESSTYNEGCLSLPEQYEDVTRPSEVVVQFLDRSGAEREEHFKELWATCAQHEIDHLDGVLFIDHISKLKRNMITKKMIKMKKERDEP